MPAVGYENISCGSPPYRLNPVPPNEKQSCLNQYRARVVSWDPPSSQSTQLNSSCGGRSHYVARKLKEPISTFRESRFSGPIRIGAQTPELGAHLVEKVWPPDATAAPRSRRT